MNICVIDLNGQFGPLNSFLDVVPALTEEGYKFTFIVPASVASEVETRLSAHSVEVIDDRSPTRRDLRIARAIIRSSRRQGGPDIIHANSTSAARGAVLGALVARLPLLIHLRNSRLSSGERRFLRLARAMPVTTAMVTVSEAAAKVAGGVAVGATRVPDPVIAGPTRSPRPLTARPVVGIVANMQLTKGFDIFVDIAQQLATQPIDFEVFGSVGLEPVTNDFVREQRLRLAALKLQGSVTFRGIVPDLREWLPQLDVMLITSRRESFSRVAVESMLAGVPLLVPDIPGLSETIDRGRFARTFRAEDAIDGSTQLLELLGAYEEAIRTARDARTWARSMFSPEAVAPQLHRIYKTLNTTHGVRKN